MEKKKQTSIHFRCTTAQKKRIKAEAEKLNLSISDYMLNSKSRVFAYRKDLLNLVENVSYYDVKLDNNINQIAKNFNTNGFVVDDKVLIELLNQLSKIGEKREQLNSSLHKIIKLISNES